MDEHSYTSTTHGQYSTYHGGGYVIDINLKKTTISTIVNDLDRHKWWDDDTRFLSIESTILNPSTQLFSLLSFKWEFSLFGSILSYHSVTSARLYPYTAPFDYFVLGLQLVFIATTTVRGILFLYNIWLIRISASSIFGLSITALSLIFSFVVIAVYIYRIDRTIYTIETVFNTKGKD